MPEAALFALHDKRGADGPARVLAARDTIIYATAGTLSFLRARGIAAHDVEELTGFPPLFGGRVKTLHPKILGAILFDRDDPAHRDQARTYDLLEFSTVAVNLYPFEETVERAGVSESEAIETIDVGGVALMRAAAKNFRHVTVLSDPSQYREFIRAIEAGDLNAALRRKFAGAAFDRSARYDRRIGQYFAGTAAGEELPLSLSMPLAQRLRYGENPHLRASFYADRQRPLPEQLHGKELSYNNLLDLDAALRLLSRAPVGAEFGSAGERFARAAIVKHTVPCGVAQRSTVAKAAADALAADPISAYGGIFAADRRLDAQAAQTLAAFFLEIVAAPEFDDGALQILRKKKQLRVVRYSPDVPEELQRGTQLRSALGGVLAQEEDAAYAAESWAVRSARAPAAQEWHDIALAWDVVRHVKSNGVVIVKDGATRGICAGQTNRVSAVEIAGARAGSNARAAACASDGFFPFGDGLEAAAAAGCTAVIAPGGSIRDGEVIAAADRLDVALVFSNRRYFSH